MNEKLIKEFIVKELIRDKNNANIGSEENLIESGLIDSLGIQKLIGYLEETFAIHFDDLDLLPENFETIKAIDKYIETKKS
jgi:acyl carrier protein